MLYCQKQIRERIEEVRASGETPMRKVRSLLELRRSVQKSMDLMESACAILRGDGDDQALERMKQSIREFRRCEEDLGRAARQILRSENSRLTFGYSPRPDAYPNWKLNGARSATHLEFTN